MLAVQIRIQSASLYLASAVTISDAMPVTLVFSILSLRPPAPYSFASRYVRIVFAVTKREREYKNTAA